MHQLPSAPVNCVDRLLAERDEVAKPLPDVGGERNRSAHGHSLRARLSRVTSTRCDFQVQTDRSKKALDRGLISFCLATLYTGTGGLCQGDARVLDLECRGEPRAALSNKITVIAMLRIGNGKACFSHGPEVEYDVKCE